MSLFSHIAFYFKRMKAYSVTVDNYGNPYGMQDIKVDFMSNINYAPGLYRREDFNCSGDSYNRYILVVHAKSKELAQSIAMDRIKHQRIVEDNKRLMEENGRLLQENEAFQELSHLINTGQVIIKVAPKLSINSIWFTLGIASPASLGHRDIVVRKGIVNE